VYSADGNRVREENFDADAKPFADRGCVAIESRYDKFRQLAEQTCLNEEGKATKSWQGVATTRYAYDEAGRRVGLATFDETGKAANNADGFARVQYTYDATARETARTHWKADGSTFNLPRLRAIFVRPGYADRSWIPDSREEALARIEEARKNLLAGVPFEIVVARYGDERVALKNPGAAGYPNPRRVFTPLRLAMESLKVGEYSEVLEYPHGFVVYQRLE
jgi:hypothetical protein